MYDIISVIDGLMNQNKMQPVMCIITDTDIVPSFSQYLKMLINTNNFCEAELNSRYILLIYTAIVRFVVISFDLDQYLDKDLCNTCDTLAKLLYKQYKDINTLLYAKQIKYWWKTYIKLNNIAEKVPSSSTHKVTSSREKILFELSQVSNRIKRFV